jgi:hypothetical protein
LFFTLLDGLAYDPEPLGAGAGLDEGTADGSSIFLLKKGQTMLKYKRRKGRRKNVYDIRGKHYYHYSGIIACCYHYFKSI